MNPKYFARLVVHHSDRLNILRQRIVEATAAAPMPASLVEALTTKVDTAFVGRTKAVAPDEPLVFGTEIDLADWVADLIARDWPKA